MQIVSIGDNLPEMLKPIFWGNNNNKKKIKILSAEIFTQHAKRKQKRVLYHVPAILTSVFICDILLRFSILL